MKKQNWQTLAIIGAQFGDEGKGKITDYFAQDANIDIRWSGGDNAGHTIVFKQQKYKLSIVPSGIFNKNTLAIVANGCVINLDKLVQEITYLQEQGFSCNNLRISDRAHIIFPYHQAFDECEEKNKQELAIGTTKKGIGPCLSDKINRIGIRIGDLASKELFREKLKKNVMLKNQILKLIYHSDQQFDVDKITNHIYNNLLPKFEHYITDTSRLINDEYKKGAKILFEGAQGTMLDIDHGTYPFVTSSNPIASSIATGSGLSCRKIDAIIGVSKAYNSRVGSGVFVSEIKDSVADYIREVAHEYGTVSKRPRRIGWFDAVITKYSAEINGFTGLAITLLDVLSGIKEIKICTSYLLNNIEIDYVPSQINLFNQCQPVYMIVSGWEEDISKIKSYQELPFNAKNYLKTISNLIGVPIALFSVGPDRTQTVIMKDTDYD